MTINKTDHYFRAALGVHVLKCAYVIGLAGSLFETFSLVYMVICLFFDGPPPLYHFPLNLISLLAYSSLMAAVKKEKVWMFWPYLFANTLCIFLDMVLIIALLTYRSELIQHKHNELSRSDEQQIAVQTIIYAVLVTFSAIINVYFIHIVWRAKIYIQNQIVSSSVYHLTGSKPYTPDNWGSHMESKPLTVP
ncbi:hypothetical protein M3Y97_00185900 [Aphelenchoides bicaudatus]|nr:hypothetical protein M3Y97_00185900 [Aphelenchoides bicaudatus]